MRPAGWMAGWMTMAVVGVWGQASAPAFEAASVKPAAPAQRIECSGGPGTRSPGMWRCSNVPLAFAITQAYGFEAYQFSPRASCCQGRFDFTARVPEGTSKEQFHQMMQTLLAERFQLVLHHEQKEMPVLELTVAEKGSRLKAAGTARTEDDPWEITPYTVGKDGYPEFPAGRSGLAGADGRYRWTGYGVSMAEIVNTLSFHLGRPVVDATGLRGKLDVDLRWGIDVAPLTERAGPREQAGEMAESGAPGPALMRAVRDQLGLKLNSKKGLGDMVVIDHVEKVPSGN